MQWNIPTAAPQDDLLSGDGVVEHSELGHVESPSREAGAIFNEVAG